MIRRTSIHIGLGLLMGLTGLAETTQADEQAPAQAGRPRPERLSPAREMAKLRRLQAQLPRELDLDDEQAEIMVEIFDEHFDKLEAAQTEQRESRRENADRVRELIQQLRDARQSGDDQLAADLRSQIAELRTGGGDRESDYTELFDEIRAELDDDQIEKFDRLIKKLDQPIRQSNRFDGIQQIRQAVQSLDLEPDQQSDVRELFVKMQREAREAGADAEALQKVEESSIEAVKDLLYDDQIEPFEIRLEELREQGGHPGKRRRGGAGLPETPADQVEAVEPAAGEPEGSEVED